MSKVFPFSSIMNVVTFQCKVTNWVPIWTLQSIWVNRVAVGSIHREANLSSDRDLTTSRLGGHEYLQLILKEESRWAASDPSCTWYRTGNRVRHFDFLGPTWFHWAFSLTIERFWPYNERQLQHAASTRLRYDTTIPTRRMSNMFDMPDLVTRSSKLADRSPVGTKIWRILHGSNCDSTGVQVHCSRVAVLLTMQLFPAWIS